MSPAISKTSTVRVASAPVSSTVDGEVVILHPETGVYYGLDTVGAWVWDSIQHPKRVEDVHEELLREFDVEADRGERDLLALLEDLAEAQLIEVTD